MSAPRRPLRATLAPATARLLVAYLEVDKQSFMAWINKTRRHLPIEDQPLIDEDLADLGYVSNWYREHRGSDVGQPEVVGSDVRRSLPHEFTTREAADVLRLSPRQVLRLVEQGALVGRAVSARQTLVTRASVLAYRQAVA